MESIGPYQVVRELGRGGMGAVYEVRHPAHSRSLALKLVLPAAAEEKALARFQREAEVMARVKHRGVVVVHQFDRAPEGPYIVSELVEGEALDKRLAREAVDARFAAELTRALADALAAVHAAGAVHRDLKPANVMIRPDGSPVVLDFGLAQDESAEKLTQTGTMLGTPRYMSPEQCDGDLSRIGPTSDIYGIGAVLYAMLAGQAPFADKTGLQLIRAVLSESPARPRTLAPGVPADLEAVCLKAMAHEPNDRYPDAESLREDLDRFLAGRPVSARPPRSKARVGALVLVFSTLLALACGGALLARPGPAPATPERRPKRVAAERVAVARIDTETLSSFSREEDDAIFEKTCEALLGRYREDRAAILRVRDSRVRLRAVVDGGVTANAARAWREQFGGLYVPRRDRLRYLERSIERVEPYARPWRIGTHPAKSARMTLVGEHVVSYSRHGPEALLIWSLDDGPNARPVRRLLDPRVPSSRKPAHLPGDRLLFVSRVNEASYDAVEVALDRVVARHSLARPAGEVQPVRTFRSTIAVSPDGELVAVAHGKGQVALYDRSFKFLRTLPSVHNDTLNSLAFVSPTTLLTSGGASPEDWQTTDTNSSGLVVGWDLSDLNDPVCTQSERLQGEAFLLAFAPNGSFLVGVHYVWKLSLYSYADGVFTPGRSLVGAEVSSDTAMPRTGAAMGSPPASAVFSPDGSRVYVGGGQSTKLGTGELRVWDVNTKNELARRVGHWTTDIVSLALTPDGTRLVSCAQSSLETDTNAESVIELWDVDLPRED